MIARRGVFWLPFLVFLSAPPLGIRTPRLPQRPKTRLVFGGDVMLSRHVGRLGKRHRDPARPFRDLAPYLSAADIAFCNLESPFSDRGGPVEKGMIFKAQPEMIEGLLLAGIDVVSTANNHARDQRGYGIEFTLHLLTRHNIAAAGTGVDAQAAHLGAVLERHGTRFGFLAYTYDQANGNYPDLDHRVATMDAARMKLDVADLRRRADVVIVSMHAGDEYRTKPNAQQVEFARAAIDAGAALVIGHHPHVGQPVERYREGVILYSLGNLVFDQFQSDATQRGLLAEATFLGRSLESVQMKEVEIRDTVPRLAPDL